MAYILVDMASITRLRLEYNKINVALFYSQPTIEYGFRHVFSAQTFLTPFRSKYRKMIHSDVMAKASSLLTKKTDFHFFPYLMSYSRVKMVDLTYKPYGRVGF